MRSLQVTALDAMPAPLSQGARVVLQAKPMFWTQRGSLMLDARQIAPWQYPVAETLCAFMIRQNKRNYVDFIVGIKEGLSWQDSLQQRYKAPRDRLVKAYGESMNLKGLKE